RLASAARMVVCGRPRSEWPGKTLSSRMAKTLFGIGPERVATQGQLAAQHYLTVDPRCSRSLDQICHAPGQASFQSNDFPRPGASGYFDSPRSREFESS